MLSNIFTFYLFIYLCIYLFIYVFEGISVTITFRYIITADLEKDKRMTKSLKREKQLRIK